jgi:hypothetical protein
MATINGPKRAGRYWNPPILFGKNKAKIRCERATKSIKSVFKYQQKLPGEKMLKIKERFFCFNSTFARFINCP